MLLLGNTSVIPYLSNDYIIYNLSSYNEMYNRIYLLPPQELAVHYNDEKTFDLLYAQTIINDNFCFMELMKVIIPLYEGKNVLLLISESLENVTESLMKFIQGRYGIISYIVENESDLETLKESDFSINGLYNLDIDKERFSRLYGSENIDEKGVINYAGF